MADIAKLLFRVHIMFITDLSRILITENRVIHNFYTLVSRILSNRKTQYEFLKCPLFIYTKNYNYDKISEENESAFLKLARKYQIR